MSKRILTANFGDYKAWAWKPTVSTVWMKANVGIHPWDKMSHKYCRVGHTQSIKNKACGESNKTKA